MKIICGLGNPGREHQADRHNIGFRIVDRLASRHRIELGQTRFDAQVGQGIAFDGRILLLRPLTYMNLSGRAVAQALRFYKAEVSDLLVAHDELDLPFGRIQVKVAGGTGGHNGLSSIVEELGSEGFCRVRFGIGKPPGGQGRVVGHVLSPFGKEEGAQLEGLIDQAADAVDCWLSKGPGPAMNQFNRRPAV